MPQLQTFFADLLRAHIPRTRDRRRDGRGPRSSWPMGSSSRQCGSSACTAGIPPEGSNSVFARDAARRRLLPGWCSSESRESLQGELLLQATTLLVAVCSLVAGNVG